MNWTVTNLFGSSVNLFFSTQIKSKGEKPEGEHLLGLVPNWSEIDKPNWSKTLTENELIWEMNRIKPNQIISQLRFLSMPKTLHLPMNDMVLHRMMLLD